VVSPCTLAERQGAVTRGQKPSKRGYLFGFGNTEESYCIMIYGTAVRGLPTDGPVSTRTPAWVSCHSGQATTRTLSRAARRSSRSSPRSSAGLRRA